MRQVKGVVKKYSREYTRTLKDGERKTYHTEQIQISIPKDLNVFDDKEEVLILPFSEKDKLNQNINKSNQNNDFKNNDSNALALAKLQKDHNDLIQKYQKQEVELIQLKNKHIYNTLTISRLKKFILRKQF